MKFSDWSFSTKAILLTLVSVTAVTAVNLESFSGVVDANRSQKQVSLNNTTLTLSDAIGTQFHERYGDVQAFAANQAFKETSKKTWVDALNSYAQFYKIYDLILFADTSGNILAVNEVDAAGKPINVSAVYQINIANEAYFKNAILEHFLADKEKEYDGTYFSDFQRNNLVSSVYGKN